MLSFDFSLRGAGVSCMLLFFLSNLLVTPMLLERWFSWEEEMIERDGLRRLQRRDGTDADGADVPSYPCILFASCTDQPHSVPGTASLTDAQSTCADAGATLCTATQFASTGFPLTGSEDCHMTEETTAFLAPTNSRCADGQVEIIKNGCMDWNSDCCVSEASSEEGEEALCADGYDVELLTGGGSCGNPDDRRPTFKCVPTGGGDAAEGGLGPRGEPFCVDAEEARVNRIVCCASRACAEEDRNEVRFDEDCCTMEGYGSCAAGFTYTGVPAAQLPNEDDNCPFGNDQLYGTICTPDESYDPQNPPTSGDYIGKFSGDAGWRCKGYEHPERKANVGWVVFINIFVNVLWIVPMILVCCYYRNKSQNTAPFNGQPVESYPQVARAAPVTGPAMQVVQMQCPPEAKAGSVVQSNINGQMLSITVPPGVEPGTMFQVQVPIMPQAPGPVINPINAPESAFDGSVLAQMGGMHINQVVDVAEMVTGCERKNRYTCHSWSPGTPDEGPQVMFINEDGDGCERVCCKQQRHCKLLVHEGHDKSGNVIMQIHKSFGLTGLCCCRPEVMIFDGLGKKIGNVEDPFKCCTMDQRVFGPDGQQVYGAAGTVCQQGVFCPCCASVEFQLTDSNGQPTDGMVEKIFGGCAEVMAKVNKFRIAFPAGATVEQKMALLGCTMLIDFEYFERK